MNISYLEESLELYVMYVCDCNLVWLLQGNDSSYGYTVASISRLVLFDAAGFLVNSLFSVPGFACKMEGVGSFRGQEYGDQCSPADAGVPVL